MVPDGMGSESGRNSLEPISGLQYWQQWLWQLVSAVDDLLDGKVDIKVCVGLDAEMFGYYNQKLKYNSREQVWTSIPPFFPGFAVFDFEFSSRFTPPESKYYSFGVLDWVEELQQRLNWQKS